MKLKIDAFSIFMIFFKAHESINVDSFVKQSIDKPLVTRIPLFTKFTIMKLKIDVFSVWIIFL